MNYFFKFGFFVTKKLNKIFINKKTVTSVIEINFLDKMQFTPGQ